MRHKSGQGITECRLACTIWPDDREELAFVHLQGEVLQRSCICQWISVGDVLQVYDSHILSTRVMRTNRMSVQRIVRSKFVSGISYKEVFTCVEVKPRASMAIARSSTSTSEPKTSGPTSGP